jgi:hypothetical protein
MQGIFLNLSKVWVVSDCCCGLNEILAVLGHLFVRLFPWASLYCSLTGLLYRPLWTFQLCPPDAPAPTDAFRTPAAEVGNYGQGRTGKFYLNADFHGTFRDLLHAANLRHWTNGFTSLPKEGVLRIFPPLKIRRLRPGLNPRTRVPEASNNIRDPNDLQSSMFMSPRICIPIYNRRPYWCSTSKLINW